MMDVESFVGTIKAAQGLPEAIGAALDPFGGVLRCSTCGSTLPMEPGDAGRYTAKGWPTCCAYTMLWWTQRQIDSGEMPE